MATSFYVYESLEDYMKMYKQDGENPLSQVKLIDLYVVPNLKLIVVTNTNNQKERLNMGKTIIHARNGILPEDLRETAKLVKYESIIFDIKKKKLYFNKKFLRKAQFETKVDRFFGNLEKGKVKIDFESRFYDFTRDRINLLL